ncbi:MAG TPA: hypothetical protein VGL42_08465 [Opitutaceae bacterium]
MSLFPAFRAAIALVAGGVIGLAFGTIQERARIRHERLQAEGKFPNGLTAMPGAFRRVAYLLVALVLVQYVCPALFDPKTVSPWCVSAGIAAGYGWTLFSRLWQRRA